MVKNLSSKRQIKYQHLIILVVLSIFFAISSCRKYRPYEEVTLKDVRIEKLINDYIGKYPQFNTFIMKFSPKQIINDTIVESGFLIGPGYENILTDYGNSLYFTIQDKRIYCISDINTLFRENKKYTWKNMNAPDSIVISSDSERRVVKNVFALFMHRAVFFRIDERDSLVVNFHPDTIFLPKYLKSSVRFENLADSSKNKEASIKLNSRRLKTQ